jgi:hypothetical protein
MWWDNHKGKVYMTVFALAALILGWGVWHNYRPNIILASCSDLAFKATNIHGRYNILENEEYKYDKVLQDCLSDAGYNK